VTSQPLDSSESLHTTTAVPTTRPGRSFRDVARICALIAEWRPFQLLILGVIVANAVVIGMETYPGLYESFESTFHRLDQLFLTIFVIEIAIRLIAYGTRPWRFFGRGWNVFDFVIVAATFVPGLGANVTFLRLIRVLRVIRLVEAVPDLRVIVRGVLRSIAPLVGVGSLVVIIVYIYAMVGTVLFGDELAEQWGTVGAAMFTCFRILTLDNWDDIYFPAAEVSGLALPYFLSFIMVATFVIMNIVIAVVVNSVESARQAQLAENAEEVSQAMADQAPELAERILAVRHALDELEANLGDRKPGDGSPFGGG
jgi:voltage-gated sodium channel